MFQQINVGYIAYYGTHTPCETVDLLDSFLVAMLKILAIVAYFRLKKRKSTPFISFDEIHEKFLTCGDTYIYLYRLTKTMLKVY